MTDARKWLGRARSIEREIAALRRAKQEAWDQLTSITQNYEADGAQTSKDPHKLDRIGELSDLIDQKVQDLMRTKAEILMAIGELEDGRHRTVLLDYYIRGMTLEEIAVEIHASYRQTKRYHRAGISEIEKMALQVP